MALEKYHGPDLIQPVQRGEVDVADNCVEQKGKHDHAFDPSVDVVLGGDAVEIIDIWTKTLEEQCGILSRYFRNLQTRTANCHYLLIVGVESLIGRGVVYLSHVRRLEGGEAVEESIRY